jgi:integrase
MASIQATAKGFRVQISVRGVRESETFASKREAQTWAARRETELRAIATGRGQTVRTLGDLLKRYREEVSPGKRGARWEQIRLSALERQLPVSKKLADLRLADFAKWRDDRLTQVGKGTVLRELGLLQGALEHARKEWEWVSVNPIKDIAKPASPPSRNRTISRKEIRAVVRALGWRGHKVGTLSESCALAFLVALRTGMRAGELCGLTWDRVMPGKAVLPLTKNGEAREVPLSPKAERLINKARDLGTDTVFGVQANTLDALFRRARVKAGLSGFTFHDSRHTAATWMAGKVDMITLCKIFGWKDSRYALLYYNPKAEDLARLL